MPPTKLTKICEELNGKITLLHAKGKAEADLAISKNKNTLRINTTRKRKK